VSEQESAGSRTRDAGAFFVTALPGRLQPGGPDGVEIACGRLGMAGRLDRWRLAMPRKEKTRGDRGNCQKTDAQGANHCLLSDGSRERGAGGFDRNECISRAAPEVGRNLPSDAQMHPSYNA
jgi:hypothetical protein